LKFQNCKSKFGLGSLCTLRCPPKSNFRGQVTHFPAQPTARLVPVEVVIPNRNKQIGSGLLARVNESGKQERVLVPETAILNREQRAEQGSRKGAGAAKTVRRMFVVTGGEDGQATVTARTVTFGEQANDKVEILSD